MDVVRKLRKEKGWSQDDLVAASHVSKSTIQRIETGRLVPSPGTAQSLGAALGIEAKRIREQAGIAVRISRVMEVLPDRDPPDRDLAPLPLRVRRIFVGFCDARRRLSAAQSQLSAATKETTAALHSIATAVARSNAMLMTAMRSPPNSETLARLQAFESEVEEAEAAHAAGTKAFHAASEELNRANTDFGDAGLAVTRLLLECL